MNNPFELFIVENEKKIFKYIKKRIVRFNKLLKIKNAVKINYTFTDVEMALFNDRICTQYKSYHFVILILFI